MLDVQGYKSSEEEDLEFDSLARKILKQDIDVESDLHTLLGQDQNGKLWIYASEEAKLYAESQSHTPLTDGTKKTLQNEEGVISRAESEPVMKSMNRINDSGGYSYAKTLRLTSEQLVLHILYTH